MSLPLQFDPEALEEYDDAHDYFDARRPGLAQAFEDEVEKVFHRIVLFPRMHTEVYRGVRRAVVNRFPYCVYYREEADHVRVVSIFHTSRNPSVWKKRV